MSSSSFSGTLHASKTSLIARSTSLGNTFSVRWNAKKNRFNNDFCDSPSLCRRSTVHSAMSLTCPAPSTSKHVLHLISGVLPDLFLLCFWHSTFLNHVLRISLCTFPLISTPELYAQHWRLHVRLLRCFRPPRQHPEWLVVVDD